MLKLVSNFRELLYQENPHKTICFIPRNFNRQSYCILPFCLKPFLFFFIAVSAMNEGHFESQLSPIMEESPNRRWETDDNAQECEGLIAGLISFISGILLLVTFPFSLCMCIRMVQVSTLSIIQWPKSRQYFSKIKYRQCLLLPKYWLLRFGQNLDFHCMKLP